MFDKILVANRGEIAARIIHTCREMGIKTVAVYSEADRGALHTQLADEAVCIGGAKSSESYLNMQNIISTAIEKGVQAIHPGIGFLAQSSMFATMCEVNQIKFIGPGALLFNTLGNKVKMREMMKEAGIPIIPGSEGTVNTLEQAYEEAEKIGYPVMVKAAVGGGGKGIRMAVSKENLKDAFAEAQSETLAAYGDGSMYLEKMIVNARHIEVQILGDVFGNLIHLGERECSLQLDNLKVLEEAPSPTISDEKREKICQTAIDAARAVGYQSVGTEEFLYAPDGNIYFMEMNTRLQVEHPVTEMVTGIDIIKEQIRVAAGEEISLKQEDVHINGCAMECRIKAQDMRHGFATSTGKIDKLLLPAGGLGLRVDAGISQGEEITDHYDNLIAKLITHGESREIAISRMKRALDEFKIEGVETNIDLHRVILNQKEFADADYDTFYLQRLMENGE